MFRACCVVIILAQTETVVQSPDEFLAVFPRMRGAFSTFYTNTTKLFPQCWRGNTKVFNIFSTEGQHSDFLCAYPAEYDVCRRLRSTLVLHPQQRAFLYNRRIFRRVKFHVFFACEFPSHPTIESNGAGVGVQHAQAGMLILFQLLRAKSSIFWPMPLPRAFPDTKRCSMRPVLWSTLTMPSGTSFVVCR